MNEQPMPTRERTCPCGAPLKPSQAAYCSNPCRVRFGRFGRTYGVVMPRALGVTKS
jgi:hypothetical protein